MRKEKKSELEIKYQWYKVKFVWKHNRYWEIDHRIIKKKRDVWYDIYGTVMVKDQYWDLEKLRFETLEKAKEWLMKAPLDKMIIRDEEIML